jgi:hypothetical protein
MADLKFCGTSCDLELQLKNHTSLKIDDRKAGITSLHPLASFHRP